MSQINIDDNKLGRYLVRRAKLSRETIERALQIQRDLPFMRLGEILLGFHAITFKDLIEALYSQFSEAMLGNILVRYGHVSSAQVDEALDLQALESQPRRIGEILVAQGKVTQEQVDGALVELELYNDYKMRIGSTRFFAEAFAALQTMPDNGSDALAMEATLLED